MAKQGIPGKKFRHIKGPPKKRPSMKPAKRTGKAFGLNGTIKKFAKVKK